MIGDAVKTRHPGRQRLARARDFHTELVGVRDALRRATDKNSALAKPKARTRTLGQLIDIYEEITGRKAAVGTDRKTDKRSGPLVRFINEFGTSLPADIRNKFLTGAPDEAKRLIEARTRQKQGQKI